MFQILPHYLNVYSISCKICQMSLTSFWQSHVGTNGFFGQSSIMIPSIFLYKSTCKLFIIFSFLSKPFWCWITSSFLTNNFPLCSYRPSPGSDLFITNLKIFWLLFVFIFLLFYFFICVGLRWIWLLKRYVTHHLKTR